MTQEDKELLLKDLSARLPYKVIVQVKDWTILDTELKTGHIRLLQDDYIELKPHLRAMSSMTEEEKREYYKMLVESQDCSFENSESATTMVNDWLLSKGFDVRGLISKGLAIAVTEENNPYKE